MRTLRRNSVKFAYALYVSKSPHLDEWGNETSEWDVFYTNPVMDMANISAAKNAEIVQYFGTDVNYDKVLMMAEPDTPIDENAILWVDTLPEIDEDGKTTTPHDYIVKRVARSLNSVAIAIAKVDVRHE